jgi:glycosyltransferase involved in cell wall biosynthesis
MMPFVSVVVPTFNRAEALRACLGALADQDYPADRYEVVVVDDGSIPAEAHANRAIADASRVRLVQQSNRGPAAARNHGVRVANGEYVAFTDDDCLPTRSWLSRLSADATPTSARGGRTVNTVANDPCADATQLLIDYLYDYYRERDGAFFTSNNLLMERRHLLELGGFDESMPYAGAEDREVCGRWRQRGWHLELVADAVVHHAHALTLGGFWRQHFTYGRGAWAYRNRRATWTAEPVRLEPFAFYRGLLTYPRSRARGWRSSALLLVSQIANASGYFYARASASPDRPLAPPAAPLPEVEPDGR